MEKIESFKVNHELLKRGIYTSRKDIVVKSLGWSYEEINSKFRIRW